MTKQTAWVGAWPRLAGVGVSTVTDSTQTSAKTAAPTSAAASGKPSAPMAKTQSGENTTPPMLAPL